MVDPIVNKSITAADLRADIARANAPVAKVARISVAAKTGSAVVSTAAETAKTLAASPPVDSERVQRIRRAVADGTFPISPATIADRLIAFEQGWR